MRDEVSPCSLDWTESPPLLKDDIHWKGGCVLGGGMLFWASFMFCWDARAPQPQYNPAWQTVWRERLERAGAVLHSHWSRAAQILRSDWSGSEGCYASSVMP